MNRKTIAIVAAGVTLAGTAAVLGAHPKPHTNKPAIAQPPPIPPAPPKDACAADTSGATASTTFTGGTLDAALSSAKVLRGAGGEVYLAVDLAANGDAVTSRPPIDVAIVLDHSGSMAGDKISRAREAAVKLVASLGERDRVTLVQFDTTAQVLVPLTAVDAAGRARLTAAITSIRERGDTNIDEGLSLARDQLTRGATPGGDRVDRIILLSDGIANVGVTDLPSLQRMAGDAADRGVRISTIGLGADYNEDLMEQLAVMGRGNYYFVADAAGIDRTFASELHGLESTVAKNTELRLEPSCAGVEIADVYGYAFRRDGNAVVVGLADLAGGDRRKIVARLRVPAGALGHEGVMKATFGFLPAGGGTSTSVSASLGLDVDGDAAAVDAAVNKDVMAKVQSVESAETMRSATDAYREGDTGKATAMIEAQQKKNETIASHYHMAPSTIAATNGVLANAGAAITTAAPPPSPSAPTPAPIKGAKDDAYNMEH